MDEGLQTSLASRGQRRASVALTGAPLAPTQAVPARCRPSRYRAKSDTLLDQLDAATGLRDLARPGNHLERLKGDRKGQWSIRINDQWRVCFEWPARSPGPTKVQIVDYH